MKEPEPAGTQSKHGLNAEQEKVVLIWAGGPSPSQEPPPPVGAADIGGFRGVVPPGLQSRGQFPQLRLDPAAASSRSCAWIPSWARTGRCCLGTFAIDVSVVTPGRERRRAEPVRG